MGYRFDSGRIIRIGTDEYHAAVRCANNALLDKKFAEPRRQFERAIEFRNSRPPDWANAVKEAVNSVEAVLQVIYDRPSDPLTRITSESLPDACPEALGRCSGPSTASVVEQPVRVTPQSKELRQPVPVPNLRYTSRRHCMRSPWLNWTRNSGGPLCRGSDSRRGGGRTRLRQAGRSASGVMASGVSHAGRGRLRMLQRRLAPHEP